jgi:hypothetical protein
VFAVSLGIAVAALMGVTMSSPDLYGPFWVATTLIFVTAGALVMRYVMY